MASVGPGTGVRILLADGRLHEHQLRAAFGQVRERFFGTLAWVGPRDVSGKASDLCEAINAEPGTMRDIVPAIELFFRNAEAGKYGQQSAMMLKEPSFGFAAWCSKWTSLREELHGRAPRKAAASGGYGKL